MQVLQYAKPLPVRKEAVDVPELGGAVVVRGLMASEAFAVQALRAQALRRVRDEARQRSAARTSSLEPSPEPSADHEGPAAVPAAEPVAPELTFDEYRAYGCYVSHLLACAVTVASGAPLYSADQWEAFGQHHPAAMSRLQVVAERLSGLVAEDVEKN